MKTPRNSVCLLRCTTFVLVFAALPAIMYAAIIAFTERQVGGSTYDQVRAMEAIDLDEDGDIDIVSVSDVLNDLTWWDNNGSETFTERTIDGSIDGIYDVKVIDIDQDGDLDIAVGAANTPKTAWYENNGSETFTQRVLSSSYDATCIDAADMDGDIDIDIVSCAYGTKIVWWDNNGSETFTERTVNTGNTTPIDIKAIDLDEDGDMDVVSTWQTGNRVFWYDNDGSETFTQRTIDSSITTPWFLDVGDIDDDGDLDVVAASITNDIAVWYQNNGSETFSEFTVGSLNDMSGVWIGDIDGDGDKDIAAIGNASNTVLWFDNDGSETFTSRTVNSSFEQGHRIQIVDVDDDGDNDLVTAGVTNNHDNVTWWQNTGVAAPTVSTFSPADNAVAVSTTANLVITFNQVVQGGTGSLVIKKTSDNSTVETIAANNTGLVSGSGTAVITINPATTLSEDTGYYVTIGANAFRNGGGRHYAGITTTTGWNFTTIDHNAPTLSTLSPLDNATGVSSTANLVMTFNEIVMGGTGTILIKRVSDDATIESIAGNSAKVTGSGTVTLTVNPATTLSGAVAYYVIVNQNALQDRYGNDFAGFTSASTWNFTTFDNVKPVLFTLSPLDNATGVSATSNLVMTFDEIVQGGTGTVVIRRTSDDIIIESITTNNGSSVTGSGTTQITLNPAATLSGSTSYYVIVNKNSFQDAFGNDFMGFTTTTTWNFTTGDLIPPLVSARSPDDDATGVAVTADLVIIFDEVVRVGTGTLTIKKSSDDSIVETITVSGALLSGNGTTQITLNPATTLDAGVQYYIVWTANAFKDAFDNPAAAVTSTATWNFTTLASVTSSSSVSASEQVARGGGTRSSTLSRRISTVQTLSHEHATTKTGHGATVKPTHAAPSIHLTSDTRQRLQARIEKKIAERPDLEVFFLNILKRLDRRLIGRE